MTIIKLNGSSIGMYSYYFYGDWGHGNTMWGNPKPIRSDEWMVQTPWILAQSQNNFNSINPFYGNGIDFTTTNVPVKNWTALFHPQFWAYFILPIEYAFAWMWWFRASLLIISAYFGFLFTTHKIFPSIALSIALFFSPFIQWWYSTTAIETLSFAILIAIFFFLFIHTKEYKHQLISLFFLVYFSACFAFELYPPFQIPVVIGVALVLIGYSLNNLPQVKKIMDKKTTISFLVATASLIFIIVLYYLTEKNSITIIRQTAYPGQRRLSGGDLNLHLIFSGVFNFFLQNDNLTNLPGLGNQCESSSFLFLSIFLLPFFSFYEIKKLIEHRKPDYIAIGICIFMALILLWGIFGLPSWIAKITLLNYVQPSRTILGLGLINIFVLAYYLYIYPTNDCINLSNYKIVAAIYSTFIAAFYAFLSIKLRNVNIYIVPRSIYIILIPSVMGGLIFLLLNKKQTLFIGIFFIISLLSSIFINPLQIGLKPIMNETFSSLIQSINAKNSINDKWVVYDNIYLSNYLAANGAHVLTGTYLYPDLSLWQKFDPEQKFVEIYNRYSHVTFSETDINDINFSLMQADVINVNINPCNSLLQSLGVKYVIFTKQTSSYSCLNELYYINYPNQSIFIYEYKNILK